MKHLITKLLLVMMCVCGIPLAGSAFTLIIAGEANFMNSKTVQSSGTWALPGVSQTSGDTGDYYFWVAGDFKLSQFGTGSTTNWSDFNNSVFEITSNNINWDGRGVSNLGGTITNPKFVHLAIRTGGGGTSWKLRTSRLRDMKGSGGLFLLISKTER